MSELLPCPFCGGEAHLGLYYRGRYAASCCICGSRFGALMPTKAEAIEVWNTRTLGSGKLTAEQVREAIEANSWAETSTIREFNDSSWQAIADELNATLGGGECVITRIAAGSDMGRCSVCGSIADVGSNYCWKCGAKVLVVKQ